MNIERTIMNSDNLATTLSFKRACLDCKECTGMCWQYFELRCLPDTILKCGSQAT